MRIEELFSVAGKTFLVTGAGRGIGASISRLLVENGASVLLTARRVKELEQVQAELCGLDAVRHSASTVTVVPGDVSTRQGCEAIAAAVSGATGGRLHGLINNAGVAWGAPLASFPESEFNRAWHVNVAAPFYLSRALLPALQTASSPGDPARIVTTASIVGLQHQPVPTYAYDASKAAVINLTRKLSAELAPAVTVNAIAPGFVPTRMSKGLTAFATEVEIGRAIPMGRWGTGLDIAAGVVYLLSPAAAWVTGTTMVVDGGSLAKPLVLADRAGSDMQ